MGARRLYRLSFWASRNAIQPRDVYAQIVDVRVDVILAQEDEVLGPLVDSAFPSWFFRHDLTGDHNFSGNARPGLLARCN